MVRERVKSIDDMIKWKEVEKILYIKSANIEGIYCTYQIMRRQKAE